MGLSPPAGWRPDELGDCPGSEPKGLSRLKGRFLLRRHAPNLSGGPGARDHPAGGKVNEDPPTGCGVWAAGRPPEVSEGRRRHPLDFCLATVSEHHPERATVPGPEGGEVSGERRWLGRRGVDVGVCRPLRSTYRRGGRANCMTRGNALSFKRRRGSSSATGCPCPSDATRS
jgi:hypothetical protein